ncbi:MAG: universal stress protein, partial [Gemmatimonadaceae bacterium]|nr:universal stress protein [Gemmatimonadaceae bacterium]
AQLRALAGQCGAGGLVVTHDVRVGPVVPTLLAYLREVGAMLVVVTTHGRRGLRRAVLGSITDALVRECPTAVLAVRARETADLPASTSGLEPVLVPFDGTERDADAIDLAKLVSTLIPTSLVLLHVIPPPRLPDRSPMAAIDRAELRQQHDVIGRYLAKQALDIGTPATPVSARIVPADDVADAITRAADREGARLIAMVTRGRGGASRWALGSVADRVLREGHHDVLLMRART